MSLTKRHAEKMGWFDDQGYHEYDTQYAEYKKKMSKKEKVIDRLMDLQESYDKEYIKMRELISKTQTKKMSKKVTIEVTENGWETKEELNGKTFLHIVSDLCCASCGYQMKFDKSEDKWGCAKCGHTSQHYR